MARLMMGSPTLQPQGDNTTELKNRASILPLKEIEMLKVTKLWQITSQRGQTPVKRQRLKQRKINPKQKYQTWSFFKLGL